eukprot:gene18561-25070_t
MHGRCTAGPGVSEFSSNASKLATAAGYGYGSAPPGQGPPPAYGGPPPAYGAPAAYGAPPAGGYGYPPVGPPGGAYMPPGGTPAGAVKYDADGQEIRTIFITGFPDDVKERELNNMCRFLPGYTASQMNWKQGMAQGFALFDSGAAGVSACAMLAHIQFDENCVLRAEVARKNMFVKDDNNMNKRPRVAGGYTGSQTQQPPAAGMYPPQNSTIMSGPPASIAPVAPQGFATVSNLGDNPPCSTLFVGNLGDTVNETELMGLFGTQGGFKQMKVVRGSRSTTAFIEFLDTGSATAVHQSLQGAILSSSERGGIRIQYSKNPFGKKRDAM